MRIWFRRIIKVLGAFLLLAVSLVLGLYLLLLHGGIRQMAVERILAQVNRSILGSIEVDEISGPLLGAAQLQGVRIFDGRDHLAAQVDSVSLRFRTLPLVAGRVVVDTVEISGATAIVRSYEDGALNWTTLTEPSTEDGEASQILIFVDELRLYESTVVYLDQSTSLVEMPELLSWRGDFADLLDQSTGAEELSSALSPRFQAGEIDPYRQPRAPIAALVTGLEARAIARMHGSTIEAELIELRAAAAADILPAALPLNLQSLDVQISETTLGAALQGLTIEDWIEGRDLTTSMLLPPPNADGESARNDGRSSAKSENGIGGVAAPSTIDAPFEALTIDLGQWTLGHALATWAAPQIELATPLFLTARAAGDPNQIDALTTLTSQGADEAITLSARLNQYLGPAPRYSISLRADDLLSSNWVGQPSPISAKTNLHITVDGEGFDPETLQARLQARLDNTVVDDAYEADLIHADITISDGTLTGHRLTALTPYLDLFAAFEFDPQGRARLHARTTADASQSLAASQLIESGHPLRPDQADLAIDAEAHFSPTFESPVDAMENLTASARWRFSGFKAEGIQVGHSTGTFDIDLERSDASGANSEIRGGYEIDADGRAIKLPNLLIGTFDIRDQARLTASLPFDEPITALGRFQNHGRINATDLATPQVAIDRLNLLIDVDKSPATSNRIDAKIETTVNGLRAPAVSIQRIRSDSQVWATLAESSTTTTDRLDLFALVPRVGIEGFVDLEEITAASTFVEAARFDALLQGPIDNPVGTLTLEAGQFEAAGEGFAQASASLSFEGSRNGVLRLLAEREQEGRYAVSTGFSYSPRFNTVALSDLEIGTDRSRWHSNPDGLLRWTGSRVEAEAFRLENHEQALALQGYFTPGQRQELRLGLESIDLAELRQGFYLEERIPPVAGQLTVDSHLDGSASTPEGAISAALTDFHLRDEGPFSIDFSARYGDEILEVQHLDINAFEEEAARMSAAIPLLADLSGRFEILWEESFDLELVTTTIDLRDLHDPLPMLNDYGIDGKVQASIVASGRVDDPRLDIDLDIQNFRFEGALGTTKSDDDALSQNQNQDGNFASIRDVDLSTQIQYHARKSGGQGMQATMNLNWEQETALEAIIETPLPLEEWIQVLADPGQDPPQWRDEFLTLPFRLRLNVPATDLSRIPLANLQEQNIAGQARIDIDIQGTIADPQGRIDLQFEEIGWDRFRDLDFHFHTRIHERQAHFERIDLTWGDDEIFVADGIVPLPLLALLTSEPIDDVPVNFRLQLQELPVSRLSPINYDFARIQGSMAAFAEIGGSLREPEVRARAGLFNTMLGDGSAGTIFLELTGADNEISLHGAACRRLDTFLDFNGTAPVLLDLVALARREDWRLPGPLNMEIHSDEIELAEVLPLQLLTDLVVDPEGILAIDLSVDGTWEEPIVEGFIELEEAAMTLPQFARRFTDITGRVELDDEAITVTDFVIADGPSSISLDGVIDHEFFMPQRLDLAAEIDEFNIGGFGVDFPVFLSADITVDGEPIGDPGRLDVQITGLEVVLTDEWDQSLHGTSLDDDIIVLGRDAGGVRPAAEFIVEDSGPLEDFHLIVDVNIDRDAWARHPNGDVNLRADITAELTGTVVTLTGSVDALRGELEFLGRLFVIQESQITFVGAAPPDPRLQLEAHHPLDRAITQAVGTPSEGEPRIIFRITGTAGAPRLELRSDPMMTDTEILSVLMTGRPPDRSDVGQDEGVAGQALAAVGGLFFGLLQEELAGTVPVDVLRLDPVVPGTEGGRLEVGKYITNDLFLSYRRQFGADEDVASNVIRLEYHFLPRWMVELLYTDRNEGGVNIYWDVY